MVALNFIWKVLFSPIFSSYKEIGLFSWLELNFSIKFYFSYFSNLFYERRKRELLDFSVERKSHN
jgi:hypothetical protein